MEQTTNRIRRISPERRKFFGREKETAAHGGLYENQKRNRRMAAHGIMGDF